MKFFRQTRYQRLGKRSSVSVGMRRRHSTPSIISPLSGRIDRESPRTVTKVQSIRYGPPMLRISRLSSTALSFFAFRRGWKARGRALRRDLGTNSCTSPAEVFPCFFHVEGFHFSERRNIWALLKEIYRKGTCNIGNSRASNLLWLQNWK